jgi:uncharacterized small protein (DUF1192 family)
MEQDEDRPKPQPGLPRPLVGLSVDELQAYKAALTVEIGRVEAELIKRQDVLGAAEALFRRPPA